MSEFERGIIVGVLITLASRILRWLFVTDEEEESNE